MVKKENLDKRICDVEEGTTNKETYREFITNTEEEIGLIPADLNAITEVELNLYLDFLSELWEK